MVRRNASKESQFRQLLSRTAMDPLTLRFNQKYEGAFKHYLHKQSIKRIRYTLIIGCLFVFLKYLYGYLNESEGNLETGENADYVFLVHFGISLPVIFTCVCATWYEGFNAYCEYYTGFSFIIVGMALTAEKVLEKHRGPVLSLFVMLIPLFGLTRLRFFNTVFIATVMILVYLIASRVAQVETGDEIFLQGFNYLAVIIGGAVSHYRQEVLRRRNYILYLPFYGDFDPQQIYSQIKDPMNKKQCLMNRRTLRFKNSKVEDAFYRFWYLIDPFPFAHLNAGALHANVYRSIRFAVGGVIFGQMTLAFQDWVFFRQKLGVADWVYDIATLLRFGVVVPAYLCAIGLMYWFGRNYFEKWKLEAHRSNRGGIVAHGQIKQLVPQFGESDSDLAATVSLEHQSSVGSIGILGEEASPRQFNYVRSMQFISAIIVFIHGISMGMILLWYSFDFEANDAIAPSYFLGLLNSILFPHRSGFRMRFIYATASTICLVIVFIALCSVLAQEKTNEYASFATLTLLLGTMISYEEEILRRAFFVRRSVRLVEFDEWYNGVGRIQEWLRRRIAIRRARKTSAMATEGETTKSVRANAQLAQASKYGMHFEAGKAVVSGVLQAF